MRVLHLIFNLRTGGTETLLIDIMREQVKAGADVSLIVINSDNEQRLVDAIDPRVDAHFLGRKQGSKNPLDLVRFNLLVRRLRPDAIHVHTIKAVGMVIGRPAPIVFTAHTTGVNLGNVKRLDGVVGISEAVARDLKSRFQVAPTVVFNGIDVEAVTRCDIPRKLSGELRLVQVGRIRLDQKGQDVAIKALAYGYDNGLFGDTRVTLDIVGDGPDRPVIESIISALGLSERVTLHGSKERKWIYDHMADYHALIQPSRIEGFGLTVAEGMAAAIPVLVSDIEGPMEVIGNGRYGLSFASDDPRACAEAIAKLIADYDECQSLASGDSLRYVTANYGIASTARRYIDLYRSLSDR